MGVVGVVVEHGFVFVSHGYVLVRQRPAGRLHAGLGGSGGSVVVEVVEIGQAVCMKTTGSYGKGEVIDVGVPIARGAVGSQCHVGTAADVGL